jgi:protein-S-isoprenylcysteine O-methyltransferase Ste14
MLRGPGQVDGFCHALSRSRIANAESRARLKAALEVPSTEHHHPVIVRAVVILALCGLLGGMVGSFGSSAFSPSDGWLLPSDVLWSATAVAAYVGFALLVFAVVLAPVVIVRAIARRSRGTRAEARPRCRPP